ncbi:TRAP transporter large permease [Acuticoccus sp. M5D2P5]|uniref:TRAP transporter large permease n=1 Tax=Acuticoccus kalidii TaxID=2910977 RepID=UPI001F2D1FA8|nr:TRAP transporter large permease [Acuticoccus kalidii]MCF3934568.1 TRAP transporter large permease [Acuticoccus kalidii]
MELAILVLTLVVTLVIGLPLPMCLAGASLAALLAIGDLPLGMIPQRFVAGINSFAFMAIPFFLLVGQIMNEAGITKRIIAFSNALVGSLPGGLAQVNVLSSMFFGGISGSATADTASIGSIMIPAMKREGYSGPFTVALTACSSTCGPIIPPSITLILYGIIAEVSITQLFLGGYVPGLMLGLGFLIMTYVISKRRNYPVYARASLSEIGRTARSASWAIVLPFLIIGGLLLGFFTVTEAAAVAVVYSLFVGIFIYRDLSIAALPRILFETAVRVGALMTVAAGALVFAWVLTILEAPQMVAEWIFAISTNTIIILLLLNILFLVIGMFMEAKAAMLILLPVILPVLPELGIDPIHFGVVVVFNLLVGLVTPPVGLCLNLAAKIGDVPLNKAAAAALPFIAVQLIVLFLITYIPGLVLWLPELAR